MKPYEQRGFLNLLSTLSFSLTTNILETAHILAGVVGHAAVITIIIIMT